MEGTMRRTQWRGQDVGRPWCGEAGMMGGGHCQWREDTRRQPQRASREAYRKGGVFLASSRGRGRGFGMVMDQLGLELGLGLGGVGFQDMGFQA